MAGLLPGPGRRQPQVRAGLVEGGHDLLVVPQIATFEQMLIQVADESAESRIVRTHQRAQITGQDELALGPREGDVGTAQLLEEADPALPVTAGEAVQDDVALSTLVGVDAADRSIRKLGVTDQRSQATDDLHSLREVGDDHHPLGTAVMIEGGKPGQKARFAGVEGALLAAAFGAPAP